MPQYRYRAVDEQGKEVSGVMEEDSAVRVTAILHEQGLQVTSVDPVHVPPGIPRLRTHLSWEDIDLLNHQLLAITKSKLPLAPSLKVLAQEIHSRPLKASLDRLHQSLEAGHSLEEALDANANAFPPMYRAALAAGERAGNLSGVLEQLCSFSRTMVETKARMQEASVYPILVVLACAAVLTFFLGNVLPLFGEVFMNFGGQLPWLTRFWLEVADFFRQHLVPILACLVGIAIAYGVFRIGARRSEGVRYLLDRIKQSIPLLGRSYRQQSLARFCQTLGILLNARVPVPDSMILAGAAAGNAVLNRAAAQAARSATGGMSLAGSLESTGYFDASFGWLVGLSEERGDVQRAFLDLADAYEHGVGRANRLIMSVFPAVLLFLMAVTVGSVVISIYLPVFTLADIVSGQ